jgi:hypothetical protein
LHPFLLGNVVVGAPLLPLIAIMFYFSIIILLRAYSVLTISWYHVAIGLKLLLWPLLLCLPFLTDVSYNGDLSGFSLDATICPSVDLDLKEEGRGKWVFFFSLQHLSCTSESDDEVCGLVDSHLIEGLWGRN